jgi:hypothetical protein
MRYQFDKDQIRAYKLQLDEQMEEKRKGLSLVALKQKQVNDKSSDLATIMSSRSNNVIRRWESLPKLTSTDITRNYVKYGLNPTPLVPLLK